MIDNVLDKDIQSFKIEDSILDEKSIVGTFHKNTVKIGLINYQKAYSNLKNTWIDTYLGKLYVYDAPEIQGEITIELSCYNLVHKFDDKYDNTIISFPCTVIEWLTAICNKVGVELGSSVFPNSTFSMNEQPYLDADATYSDAVKMIAGSGCFAQIIDDKLYIKWFDSNVTVVNNWFSLNQQSETDPINLVILGRGDAEDNIKYPIETPDNPKEMRIDNNQLLYFNREEMIVPIYNQVNGFKYRPFKISFPGGLNLKAGQKIKYIDFDGLEVETYVMSITHEYVGGDYTNSDNWDTTAESVALTETSTNYNKAGTIIKRLTNAEFAVDKNANDIKAVVESVEGQNSKIASVEITAEEISATVSNQNETINQISQTVESTVQTIANTGGSNLLMNAIGLFGSDYWTNPHEPYTDTSTQITSGQNSCWKLMDRIAEQIIPRKINGTYTVSFIYKKTNSLANISVMINGTNHALLGTLNEYISFENTFEVVNNEIDVKVLSDTDNSGYILNLMINSGDSKIPYSNNANETVTDTIKSGKGLEITATGSNSKLSAQSDGIRVIKVDTGETKTEFTDKGTITDYIESNSGSIAQIVIMDIGDQTLFNRL